MMTDQGILTTFEKQIDKEVNLPKKVDLLIDYAKKVQYKDTKLAIEKCQLAIQLISGDKRNPSLDYAGLVNSLLLKGYCHQLIGEYRTFIEYSLQALPYAEMTKDVKLIAMCYLRMGQGHLRIGQYVDAYQYLYHAQSSLKDLAPTDVHVYVKLTLAILHNEIGNHEHALEENFQALELAHKVGDEQKVLIIKNNIGKTYLELKQFEAVLEYTYPVIEYIQKNKVDILKSFIGSLTALSHVFQGNLEKADYYVNLFFDFLVRNNDKKGLALAYYTQAVIAHKRNQFDLAIEASSRAAVIAKKINARDDEQMYLGLLATLHEEIGDYKAALEYFQEAQNIKQSIFNRNSTHRMQILEITHQTEKAKQEAEIFRLKSLELENKFNEKKISLDERTNELKQSLERETQLGYELKEALEKEEQISQLKTQIIETVSHEFRTPLTVMNTSSELLRFYNERLTQEKKQKHLRHIQESVRYLTEILNETIFIGQVSQYPIVPMYRKYQESEFCEGFLEKIHDALGPDVGIEILCRTGQTTDKEPSEIITDLQLVHRATVNLLNNAIKYSEDASSIVVLVQVGANDILVEVADNGIGIPLDAQENIFDLFFRADNARVHRGVGFGLHISKMICDVLSAEISAYSEGEGKGSIFKLRFPKIPHNLSLTSMQTSA